MHRLTRNSIVFFLALVAALALFSVIKYPALFEASVLDAQHRQVIVQHQRDIAYLIHGSSLDIFLNPEKPVPSSLRLTIDHDPNLQILPTLKDLQCSGSLNIQDTTTFSWSTCPSFSLEESIVSLPFTGLIDHLLLEEALAFSGNSSYDLSIGNLGFSGAVAH